MSFELLGVYISQDLNICVKFGSGATVQRIIVIVEGLGPFGHELKAEWLRSDSTEPFGGEPFGCELRVERLKAELLVEVSNRLTCNVIRNQQRNRKTLDETNIVSLKTMDYYFPRISSVCPSRAGKAKLAYCYYYERRTEK